MSDDDLQAQITHLHDCVEILKVELKRNTEVTEQVRDILGTFRITLAIAKWVAALGAAAAAVKIGWHTLISR